MDWRGRTRGGDRRLPLGLRGKTMTNNKMRAIHPGEILREEFLVPLGMSANALAMALRVPAPRVNDIVRERRAITPDTALRLARYFDTTPEFWLNLQSTYDLKQAEQALGHTIRQEVSPMAVAA
jgi:addiction module HigA family antidote